MSTGNEYFSLKGLFLTVKNWAISVRQGIYPFLQKEGWMSEGNEHSPINSSDLLIKKLTLSIKPNELLNVDINFAPKIQKLVNGKREGLVIVIEQAYKHLYKIHAFNSLELQYFEARNELYESNKGYGHRVEKFRHVIFFHANRDEIDSLLLPAKLRVKEFMLSFENCLDDGSHRYFEKVIILKNDV